LYGKGATLQQTELTVRWARDRLENIKLYAAQRISMAAERGGQGATTNMAQLLPKRACAERRG
jgi:hypothetical protein